MKSQYQDTKARSAKIESIKRIRAAYLSAKAEGQVKTDKVQPA